MSISAPTPDGDDRPVLLLFDDGTAFVDHRKRFLERLGYRVLLAGEVAPDVIERAHEVQVARSGSAAAPTLLSVSKAARLMRASTFALNSWLAAGWLTDHGTRSGRRIVDLREALLVAGLRNGPSCIPDELAEVDDLLTRAVAEPDPCLGRVHAWSQALGALPEESLASAIARFHRSGFTCAEIAGAVGRLSGGQPPPGRP